MEDVIEKLKSSVAEDDDEVDDPNAETNNVEKDSEGPGEARQELVKDTHDESESPSVPPSNGPSKPSEDGHSKLADDGHLKPTQNGLSKPSDNGHSNGLAFDKLIEPVVNGQVLTVESGRDISNVPKKVGIKAPKKRGRKVVKDSDEEASDVESEYEVPVKRKRGRPAKGTVLNSQKVV